MPLDQAEWEEANLTELPLAVIYDFLSNNPNTAYKAQEIAKETRLYEWGRGENSETIDFGSPKQSTSEEIGEMYYRTLLAVLVELGKIEAKVQDEPSDTGPHENRGVIYYRASGQMG